MTKRFRVIKLYGKLNFKMYLPKIYPITDTHITNLSHTEQVKRLIEGGAKLIQLREKYSSPKVFYEDALEAVNIARTENVRIIINDRVDLALALKADGVHLGQNDLSPIEARKILGKNAIIGFSTHNLRQASETSNLPINYAAIGPVFVTKTKISPDSEVGLETIKKVREVIGDLPLVAIGGINSANFLEVLKAADSVAIINDLLSDPNEISAKTKIFITKTQNIEN
ncbi:thiamine phosphate synthase [soil metagenome]